MTGAYASDPLLCTAAGCVRRWTCDFGKRLCSDCDRRHASGHAQKSPQRPIDGLPPLRDAVRPFSEPTEPDEEYVHDQ